MLWGIQIFFSVILYPHFYIHTLLCSCTIGNKYQQTFEIYSHSRGRVSMIRIEIVQLNKSGFSEVYTNIFSMMISSFSYTLQNVRYLTFYKLYLKSIISKNLTKCETI